VKSLLPWLVVVVLGFALGAYWRESAHAGWQEQREAVLAKSDSVQSVADALAALATEHRQRADSLGREAQRLEQQAIAANQQTSAARLRLKRYQDSVVAAGDSTVPIAVFVEAVAVIDSQQSVIGQQRAVIRTLAADTATLAAAGRLHEQATQHWMGRAGELEQTLQGYRAKPASKLFGLLPAPSPTLSLVLGALVGVVLW
jgi:hypothetical protein